MNIQTTYQRFNPTTVNGEMIEVKTIYSSFDSAEIDALEKDLQNAIGFGTIIKADKNCKDCKYSGKPIHEVCKSCVNKDRFKKGGTE